MGEWCLHHSERLHLSRSLLAVVQYVPFLPNKDCNLYLAFLFAHSPLLMRFAWEHTFCFVLELVCSSAARSHTAHLRRLLQRAKALREHREGQGVIVMMLLASQGSVSLFPGRWEGKQFSFFIRTVTEPPHTPWIQWLPYFMFLVDRRLLLCQRWCGAAYLHVQRFLWEVMDPTAALCLAELLMLVQNRWETMSH